MPKLMGLVFAICLVAQPSLGGDRDKVVGTWKQVFQEVEIQTTGQKEPMLREKPPGYAVFLPEGRVFFILTGEGRKPAKTDQERAALLNTVVADTAEIVDS